MIRITAGTVRSTVMNTGTLIERVSSTATNTEMVVVNIAQKVSTTSTTTTVNTAAMDDKERR